MPIQVPLLNGGNIPLRQTGISVPRTAQLQAGNPDLGRAVSQIGADLGKLAEREQRANDARQMLEFETAMRAAEERQQLFQQETQEQDAWLPNWQTQEQELQKSLEGMKLSPEARLTLQSTLGRYVDNKRMSIREQAVNQAEGRARTGFGNRVMQAKSKNTAVSLIPTNMMTPEEIDRLRIQGEKKVEADQLATLGAQESELVRLGAQGDANAWIELKDIYKQKKDLGELDPRTYELKVKQANDGEVKALVQSRITGSDGLPIDLPRAQKIVAESSLTPDAKAQLELDISQARNRYANQDLMAFTNRMAKGEVVDGNDFDSPYMGPAELAEIRTKINEATPTTPEQQASFYLETMKLIDEFDPVQAKENDYSEMVKVSKAALAIRKAPPHLRDMLSDAMQAKLSGSAAKTIVSQGEATARDMLLEIVKGQEAEFFQGEGADKKLNPAKAGEWMKFQQKIFSLQADIYERIKDVKDTKTIDKIVQDALHADYVKVKKQQRYTPSGSGFSKEVPATEFDGPYRIPMPASGPVAPLQNPFLPSFNAFQQ